MSEFLGAQKTLKKGNFYFSVKTSLWYIILCDLIKSVQIFEWIWNIHLYMYENSRSWERLSQNCYLLLRYRYDIYMIINDDYLEWSWPRNVGRRRPGELQSSWHLGSVNVLTGGQRHPGRPSLSPILRWWEKNVTSWTLVMISLIFLIVSTEQMTALHREGGQEHA